MTTAEALAAARKLIDTPEKWGKFSDRVRGLICAHDALVRAMPDADTFRAALLVLREQLPGDFHRGSLVRFNDHPSTTHADVMALFDRAIAAAKENP